jgi:hypothetical protein
MKNCEPPVFGAPVLAMEKVPGSLLILAACSSLMLPPVREYGWVVLGCRGPPQIMEMIGRDRGAWGERGARLIADLGRVLVLDVASCEGYGGVVLGCRGHPRIVEMIGRGRGAWGGRGARLVTDLDCVLVFDVASW